MMLKAASLLRPVLSRSCLTTQNVFLHRVPANSLKLRPNNPLWRFQGSSRCIMDEPGKEVSASVEAAMKSRDSIPKDFRIIYRAPHEYYVKVTYLSAVIAVVTVPVLTAAIYLTGNQSYPMELGDFTLFEKSSDAYLMLGLLALTIVNIAKTVAKYPMRIYRNPLENKYIGVFQHAIPGRIQQVEFSAGEVQKANGWVWKDSTYAIKKKRKVLLIPDHFSTPIELERMTIEPHKDSPVEKHKRRSRMV